MTWKIGSRQNEIRCTKRTRQTGISSKQRHNPRLQFHVKWSAPDSSALFRLTFRHPLCTFEESRTACHLSWSQFSIQLWLQIETSSVPAIPCLSGTHRRDSPISLEHSIRDTDPNATGGGEKKQFTWLARRAHTCPVPSKARPRRCQGVGWRSLFQLCMT